MPEIFRRIIKRSGRKENIDILLLFAATLIVYIHNLSPSVYGGDSGDFITAALTRGVPHPSGYPLYTMLGIIFTSLPIPFTPAWKFGLVSAIFSSLSVVLIYLIVDELTKKRYLAIITSLTLAFTYPFWLYAEIAEVFALHSFFILALIFLAIKFINSKNKKFIYALAFFAGLSLSNNLIILLLFPGIFLALLLSDKKIFFDVYLLFKSVVYFFIGLIPYIYIPVAARSDPFINWGRAVNLKNFIFLVLRKDYGWINLEFEKNLLFKSLTTYFDYWSIYSNILIPAIILLGIIYLVIKKNYPLLVLLLLSYFLFGPFFIIYARAPLESFLTLGVLEKFYIAGAVVLLISLPFGVLLIQDLIPRLLKNKNFINILQRLILIVFSLIPITSFLVNFERTNLSKAYVGDNFGIDILSPLPENSIVFLRGDNTSFNSLYIQIAYNLRGDIYIPGRHGGFGPILKEYGLSDEEAEKYTIEKRSGIEKEVLASTIAPLLSKRDIFSDAEIELIDSEYGRIVSVPYGLLYKLEFEQNVTWSKEEYLGKINGILSTYHTDELKKHESLMSNNLIYADIKKLYSLSYLRVAEFIKEEYEDLESAKIYLEKAGELDPLARSI